MGAVLALEVTSAELMDTLRTDDATLLRGENSGYLLPGPAALTLLADEIHKWLKPTVKGAPATGPLSLPRWLVINDFRIHDTQDRVWRACRVSEQWAG